MKRFLLLCLGLLMAAQVASAVPAGMVVRSERGLPFRLRLDGHRIGGRYGMTLVRFDRLAPGQHWAEFQIPANGGFINYRTRVQLLPGRETRFVLVTRRGFPPVLQRFDEGPLPGWAGARGPGHGGRYEDDDYGYRNEATPYGNTSGWPVPGRQDDWYGRDERDDDYYDGRGSYNQGGHYNGGSYGNNYRHLMAPREVDDLLRAVQAQSFDDRRVTLIKQALDQSEVRAEDLRRLLESISFENAKVDLAKFGYARVADRQNFYRVYEAFDFDASVREVQRYIDQNRS